jgi:CRP/FNR family transcriptional regulator, anaerobic regulatory protein
VLQRVQDAGDRDTPITAALLAAFPGVGPETRAELESTARSRTRSVGEVVYSADGPARVGVLVSGLLRTVVPMPDGRRVTLHHIRSGGIYGLTTIFHPVPLSVEVVRRAIVIEIDPATIKRLARKSADLGWLISRQLAGAVLQVPAMIEEFGFKLVRQRVARHLLDLCVRDPHQGLLVARVTRQALAESVGTAREVVSRCLRSFSDAGFISMASASITILNAEALEQLSA